MVKTDNREPDWIFYLGWVVLSAISVPIAWNIMWVIMTQITRSVGDTIKVGGQTHITEDFLGVYILLPVLGLITGLLQYPLLHRYLSRMGWWIGATFLGWLLLDGVLGLLAIFTTFREVTPPAIALVLALLSPAGSFGLTQWLALRTSVRHAALWILATALGWAIPLVGGPISNQYQIMGVMLFPPIVGCIAWWLLLDRLPQLAPRG